MRGRETARRDKFGKWEQQQTWDGLPHRGMDKYKAARIDVVATITRGDELQWPTANVKQAARAGGYAATSGERERENTVKYGNRSEIGPDTVKPISFELGGRTGRRRYLFSKG